MSELKIEQYEMPAADLGTCHPLVPFHLPDTADLVFRRAPGLGLTEDDVRYIGYGYVPGCLPYFVQDNYTRQRRKRSFRVAVLENDRLRATFLLDLGGRLWSLHDKRADRELLHRNPVFQPANLGIRNAWFSGGVEWNFAWIGHTPLTCEPLFAARVTADDGSPVLRLWEYERVRQMSYQIDAWLPEGSPVLLVRIRLANRDDRAVPVYWWSNVAVPELPDGRILTPADDFYSFGYEKGVKSLQPYPVREGTDYSYPRNSPHGGDRFFRIKPGQYPWIAWADGQGRGSFESSTSRLQGRKLWVFGQGAGGRRWQDFLNTPGHPYVEIQGGVAQTQTECLPLPPRTEWEWLEAYGPFEADPKVIHGSDWAAARQAAQRAVESNINYQRIEQLLAESRPMAQRKPEEIIHRGSGWGWLENLRRARAGQESFAPPAQEYPADTLGPEQQPWIDLLETGKLPYSPPSAPPVSYMIQPEWQALLEQSLLNGHSGHWLAWLHLGMMHIAHSRAELARAAWEKSIALEPSAWAYRHLAALAALQDKPEQAAELYAKAVELAPGYTSLVIEGGKVMVQAKRFRELLEVVDMLPPAVRQDGHVQLLEAQAAIELDLLDRAWGVLNREITLTRVREGDAGPAEIWFAYHEKRLASQNGKVIDQALKDRVRKECPPPAYLDYRLS